MGFFENTTQELVFIFFVPLNVIVKFYICVNNDAFDGNSSALEQVKDIYFITKRYTFFKYVLLYIHTYIFLFFGLNVTIMMETSLKRQCNRCNINDIIRELNLTT